MSEVSNLLALNLVMSATNAKSERATTMHQARFNHLTFLHFHKKNVQMTSLLIMSVD